MDSFRAPRRVEGPRLSPRPRREGPVEAIQGGELPIPPCRFQQVLSKLLDFSDCGHEVIIVGAHVEASKERTRSDHPNYATECLEHRCFNEFRW